MLQFSGTQLYVAPSEAPVLEGFLITLLLWADTDVHCIVREPGMADNCLHLQRSNDP